MLEKFTNSIRWMFWKANRRFLEAFAEALVGPGKELLQPDGKRIMDNLEVFLKEIPSNAFKQITLALMVMPLSAPATLPRSGLMRFLVKLWHVLKGNIVRYRFPGLTPDERARRVDELFRRLAGQAAEQRDDFIKTIVILSTIKQLLSASYLELDSTWDALGYSPYPKPPRSWNPPSGPVIVNPPRTSIGEYLHQQAKHPREVRHKEPGVTNYCVIGSGAGGAVVAHRIKELDKNARVVILESGPLVTNEAFPTRMLRSVAQLYMNAGSTLSKDQMSQFRQGHCVGGSTTLNNGVAIKPEGFWWDDNLVRRWQEAGVHLAWDEFNHAFDEIRPIINAHPIEDRIITTMGRTVAQGFAQAWPALKTSTVPINITECIGCGRCNLGCQYDAKQSMLTTCIPKVVEQGGLLVPNTHVEKIKFKRKGDGKTVTGLVVSTDDGESIEIEADKFVLAAGAYASSKLLWKSGFTGAVPGVRTVGKRFAGNLGSGVLARFPKTQNGWAGQQVGFVVEVPAERMIIETAFAPPQLLGLTATQWGPEFMKLVESYNHLAVAIPVFSTFGFGQIDRGALPMLNWLLDYRLGGFVIDFAMSDEDWRRLAKGLKLSAKAMFAMGAEEIYTTRFNARTLKPGDDIDAYFDNLGPVDYLHVETAHLQGGNVLHHDPGQGVVDENFKVHGIDNLWISDASVIPSPITLNIQFTIMALAWYAARRIVAA